MASAVGSILRAATRGGGEPLNVLTAPTHERWESNLCKTGHRFWAVRTPYVKDWNRTYAPLPDNYVLLNPDLGEVGQLPPEVDFDLVLSQNKAGQYQLLSQLARLLHLPLVTLEHTLPHPSWSPKRLAAIKQMRGDVNVFISEFSRRAWGWGEDEAVVVHHGVDTDVFRPVPVEKVNHVLSVVNDFNTPERRWCCGIDFWQEATHGLPRHHLGSSPDGWSEPAESVGDLVSHYSRCAAFVDTASASPIPSVVLEAMACQAVVVSRGNAMVPEVITDGVNGFICDTPGKMRAKLKEVLSSPDKFREIGEAARKTILERFSLARFVGEYDLLFRRAADTVFTGG